MSFRRSGFGFSALLACLLCAAPHGADGQTSYLKPNDTIAIAGDSVISSGASMEYMQAVIDGFYPGSGIKILNYGSGGKSSDSGVTCINMVRGKGESGIFVTMYGINDIHWSWGNIEAKTEKYLTHMKRQIEIAQKSKLNLIFARETHLSFGATGGNYPVKLSWGLEHLLRGADILAAEHNVPVVDVQRVYRESLAAAWFEDPKLQFSPDVGHPTQPGQAAIAAAMLEAFGVGLPLATEQRGPLHLVRQMPVRLEAVGVNKVIGEGDSLEVTVVCRNLSSRLTRGVAVIAVGDYNGTKLASVGPYGVQKLSFKIPAAKLKGRWGCLPLYMAFKGKDKFAADHALLFYSRIFPAVDIAFAVTSADFGVLSGKTKRTCPVSRVAANYDGDTVSIEFDWPDNTVPAKSSGLKRFKNNANMRGGQFCDAVEFFFDLRPYESTGRFTSSAGSLPAGVIRVVAYKIEKDGKFVAQLSAARDAQAAITQKAEGTYVLTMRKKSDAPTIGFSIRVTNADENGPGKGICFYLTRKPDIAFEPMSYIRLGAEEAGIFCRIGY